MNAFLYWLARAAVAGLQAMPLESAARFGRAMGALFFWLDARHRRVALDNLRLCFGADKSAVELRALAREHFRRLGENYSCAIKTAAMPMETLQRHVTFQDDQKILRPPPEGPPQSLMVAIGHFGNFELYARIAQFAPMFRCLTTYRSLRQPSLNRLMQSLRRQSGCLFFERRTESAALKAALKSSGVILGLLADQHAGDKGLRLPFFGRECSTSAAPALFALRYRFPLFTAVCFRTGLARWQIEVGDEIPTRENGRARPVEAITSDINRAFEQAIRRDPANWFWVHKRWKPAPPPRKP